MQTLSLNEYNVTDLINVTEGEHIIARFFSANTAPSLLVIGAVHGNEQSGVRAMRNIAAELEQNPTNVIGNIWFLAGNTRAINKNVRFLDADLNRHWTLQNVERNRPESSIHTNRAEDIEQRELLTIFAPIFKSAQNEVYAIDLHSTSSPSTPFAMTGDTIRNRTFARKFPTTFLLGIEEQLDGTIMEYVNDIGAVTLGFEAGQHTTKEAVQNQEALIWLALRHAKVVREDALDWSRYEDFLSGTSGDDEIVEIRYRHEINSSDAFVMEPGFSSFQRVSKGELLAHDKNGAITAWESGLILMPLYQKQGSDGYFLGRRVAKFWLWLSRLLRKTGAGNLMKYLPGVSQHPEEKQALIVNTRVARILPLQVFHLLGFRKMRWSNDKLVVTRRKHDTKSPFLSR